MVSRDGGPVLGGILAGSSVEDLLGRVFPEAAGRGVPLHLLIADPAGEEGPVRDAVERWAGRFPEVPLVVTAPHGIDAAIALVAAARTSCLVVCAEPADGRAAAVLRAVAHRVRCGLIVVPVAGQAGCGTTAVGQAA